MPLPAILAGIAFLSSLSTTTIVTSAAVGAAGAYAFKKGRDAKRDFDDAEEISVNAQGIFENARHSLDERRKKTQTALESLGQQKLLLFRDALNPFVETFSRIKNVDYEMGERREGRLPDVSIKEIQGVRDVVQHKEDAVFGALLLGPVGVFMLPSEAKEAKENALSNLRKARVTATAMEEAEVAARDIGRKATQVRNVLKRLQDFLCSDLEALEQLVSDRTDFDTYDPHERELVYRTASLAVTAKNLAEATLLDENGLVTNVFRQEFRAAKRYLKALGA